MVLNGTHNRRALWLRFSLLLVVVLAAAAVVYLVWNWAFQAETAEDKALVEARTLNLEILAAWDYVDSVQNNINYNHDGAFDFKGVYCSVAGKNIAKRFTQNSSGYTIRFVRDNPRTAGDEPDGFEAEALAAFAADGSSEYYGIAEVDGQRVFRYLNVLRIGPGCLTCHGDPAGEKDVTGFMKEGMQLDDIGGAASIIIPLDAYEQEAQTRTTQTVLFFLALMVGVVLIVRFALKRWVTDPLIEESEELTRENETKSNYLASMSHEMRTPLTSIIAFTELWEKSAGKGTGDEEEMVREIKENSMVLLDMVNNSIDVARLEAGRFEIQLDELDVVDVVNASLRTVSALALKRRITLEKAIDPRIPIVVGDWDALRKILVNLLSNAIKYTPEGGTVRIEVSYHEEQAHVEFTVVDDGIGIAEEDLARIFDKYVQVGSRRDAVTGSSGSGLGLFLVKCLVEELGADIQVRSTPGRGSVFTVSVPAERQGSEGGDRFEDNAGR